MTHTTPPSDALQPLAWCGQRVPVLPCSSFHPSVWHTTQELDILGKESLEPSMPFRQQKTAYK